MRLLNGVVRQAAASAWRSANFVNVFSAARATTPSRVFRRWSRESLASYRGTTTA